MIQVIGGGSNINFHNVKMKINNKNKKSWRKNYAQKILMAVLLLTTALHVTACGKETESPTDVPVGSPSVEAPSDETEEQVGAEEDSQSAEETEGSEGEGPHPAEEEEEAIVSYIFSNMPVAAYEVTGLGVGRFESVYEEEIFIEYEDEPGAGFYFNAPLVRLTPGENTFVIFCIPGDVELTLYENGGFSAIGATIHSPSGSSQWEAITYSVESYAPEIEGFSKLERNDASSSDYVYDEETRDGHIYSIIDPNMTWIRFAEIYHPDAQQNDAIYAIEAYGYPGATEDHLQIDGILSHVANVFDDLGATSVKEIPVEEALERCNVVVSEGDTD